MKYAPSILIGVLSLWSFAAIASAQPVLERLEQRIRERVKPLGTGLTPADRGAVQQPLPPASQPAGVQPPKNIEPGYLGMVADDQKDRGRGVRVLDLRPAGPAEQAGIRRNDLVNGVAGIRVRQMTDLADVIGLFSPGDALTFDILRDGKQHQVTVKLGHRPAVEEQPEVIAPPPAESPIAPNIPSANIPLLNGPQVIPPPLATPAKTAEVPTGTLAGTFAKMFGNKPAAAPGKPPAVEPLPVKPPVAKPPIGKPPLKPVVKPPADAETIEQLKRRIAELERHVAELEKDLAEAKRNK